MLKYQTLSGTEVHIAKFWSSTWANSHQVYSKSLNHAKTRQKLQMRLWKDLTSPIINFEQIGAAHFTGGLDVKTIRTLEVTLQTHLAGVRTPWAPYQIFSARFCAPFRWNKRQSEIISVDDCSIPNRQFSIEMAWNVAKTTRNTSKDDRNTAKAPELCQYGLDPFDSFRTLLTTQRTHWIELWTPVEWEKWRP